MRVRVLAVGKARPGWARDASEEYLSRLKHYGRFELQELKASRSGKDPRRAVAEEGQRVLAALRPGERLVALDQRGKTPSSEELSRWLGRWQREGRSVTLAIGGALGFDPAVIERAEGRLSLSSMTLPHLLARVVLLEQLYRAGSLLRGEPYHNP